MIHRNSRIVHHDQVRESGIGHLGHRQPESLMDFGIANDSGVRFHLDVHGTVGTFDSWELRVRFKLGMMNVEGAGDAKHRWYDLQPEQVKTMIQEGVDWYGGIRIPRTITNLVQNPSWEVSAGGNQVPGDGGAVAVTRPDTGGFLGAHFRRLTWTTGTTSPSGSSYGGNADPLPAGRRYMASARFAGSRANRHRVGVIWYNAAGTRLGATYGTSAAYPATTIAKAHRATAAVTAPTDAVRGVVVVDTVAGEGAANWQAGDTLDTDAFMLVAGDYLPDEFTGDSPNAKWNGDAQLSTSTLTLPPVDDSNIVATSRDTLPVTVSRSIRGFGQLVAVEVKPTFVNGSEDAAIIYSLNASY